MAELVLSALLPVLFEKLTSTTLKNIARRNGIDAEIKKWQRSLTQIDGLLADASQKEITSAPVKRWLNDLQHLAYDIDDILDGWLTEAMQSESTHESEGIITSKVRKLIPTCCTNFSRSTTMLAELDDISTKLQDLVKEKDTLGFIVKDDQRRLRDVYNRRFQSSIVNPASIVGRQSEKETLVQQLLLPADEPCDQNYSIVPILGMGGVGKTTLARHLYDDQQVKDHFELKAWVCVSDEFDSFAISKVIFQSVAGVYKEFADLNLLQEDLVNHLRGRRFLLVLDDVWSESYEDWKSLVGPFHACGYGSKIIITTRKDQLLKMLVNNPLGKQLGSLSDIDALSLVARHALGVNNFDSNLSLKPFAEGIVKKCGGIPLALVALGRLLRTKKDDVEYWREVSNSEMWRLKDENGILPALRLSYHDLSANLKQLFAYCSLFPKDFLFNKEELVLLWTAEGFLHQPTSSDSTAECLGHQFFDELLSRSFFQHAPNNESFFVMHDLMNDLATSVAIDFYVRLDNENEKNFRKEMLEKCRHMSFVRERYVAYKKFEAFTKARSLRTFLATSFGEVKSWGGFYLSHNVLTDLLPGFPLLRVLSLSNFPISEVPESIGTLRHLRYLNLSNTSITHLPEKVCNLCNLQTLFLVRCYALTKLPNNFQKLKNLRHLDVRHTPLLFHTLLGVSDLKSLQITLSDIIIETERGFEIAKLKDFKNLYEEISIVGLDKVKNVIHAHDANLSQIPLSVLALVWSDELYDSRNEILEKDVLNELKPRVDKLIQLKIRSYGGLEFPKWVGDPLFLNLKHVTISDCKRCTSLPPVAQLPSLTELFIKGLYGVEVVGFELFGFSRIFPSLKILSFEDMRGWKKWSGFVFPCLQKLEIKDCPNLVEVALETLPSLNDLKLYNCDIGVLSRLVQVASAVTKLEIIRISGLNDMMWRVVIEYLVAIEELTIKHCHEIRYLVESDAYANKVLIKLRKLNVNWCDKLMSLGEKEEDDNSRSNLLTSLRILEVWGCDNMKRCNCPNGIEELSIWSCSSITVVSFQKGGPENLRSLQIHNCKKLLEREWWGQKMNNNRSSMPMLENVWISDWPNLKSIIELNSLVHLTTLEIEDCECIESFPDNLTSLRTLHIVNCPRMDVSSPGWVWPPNLCHLKVGKLKKPIIEWGPQNFPTSLMGLHLYGEDRAHSCSEFSHLLPSSLTHLEIFGFKKLESISMGLQHLTSLQSLYIFQCPNLKKVSLHPQHLTSLQHLSFYSCPNIMDLPKMLLPSLLGLTIEDCPNLKERCGKKGYYWPLISHIPYIHIISYSPS